MKTTKHIQKLATAMSKDEPTIYREAQINYMAKELTKIKNAMLSGKFYAGVISVSRSGMSRKIKLAYIYKNRLVNIGNPNILKLAGVSPNGSISGCGMDMLFKAQYNLFVTLCGGYKRARYSERMKQYNNF
jgi:hypothetical protein